MKDKKTGEWLLVTGVSSGIGYDAVRFLTGKGYKVFGSVRKEADKTKLLKDFPAGFVPLVFDVRDKEVIFTAVAEVREILGGQPLAGLINNAGLSIAGPMSMIPDEDFREQLEVNLIGVRNVTNAFLPLLGMEKDFQGQPGKIINISSLSGIINSPFSGSYCVSKHALESLGEIYRRELMVFGIDVVSIQPGPIRSEIWEKNIGTMERYKGTVYDQYATLADKIISDAEKRALPTETISKLIYKILNTDRPKTSYMVTKNKWLMRLAKRLPPRMLDKLIWKKLSK
ncbi:MAG: SDR family NAD(P)-dependent oxidoreductase [Cyclobacteriaceae bacterium]